MERFDEIEEDMQEAFLERFSGPLPKLREPPTPPADSLPLETWAPPSLVSAEYEQNVLSFRTRYFHDSSEWTPPETKKASLPRGSPTTLLRYSSPLPPPPLPVTHHRVPPPRRLCCA